MRVLLVLAVSLSCLVATVDVDAQSSKSRDARIAEAKKAFSIGTQAYGDGDFDTALASFRRAYELTASADLLFNVATVADRMRRDDEALEAYEAYLSARPDSADKEHVEGRIEALRAAIEERRRAEIEADIEAERAAVEAAAKVRAERPLTQHVGPGPGPWITIGASGAAVVSGAVLLGMGQRNQNEVENATPGSSYSTVQDAADRGPRLSKAGIALLSVGGAGIIGGVIWQLTGGHDEALPEISIGPTGISVKGRF